MDETTERVYRRALYARFFRSMSLMDAKRTLGFPPEATPSEDEVRKAQRIKIVEFGHEHGGDPEKIKAINIASEILRGNYNADDQPRIRHKTEDTPRPPKRPPPETVDTIKGQSFEQAVAGLPHAIWRAISKPEWCEHPRDEKNTQRGFSSYVWVLFGDVVNSGSVVVVGLKQRGQNLIFDPDKGGNVIIEPDWQASHVIVQNPNTLDKVGPATVKKVTSGFADGAKPRRYPQKYVAFPGSGALKEETVLSVKYGSGGANLKDILLSTGLVSEDHPALQGRKTNVEVIPHFSSDKMKRLRAERPGGKLFHYECFDYEVRVNGKSATLSDEAIKNLEKNIFISGVFSYDPHDNVPKNLTKLRPRPRGLTLGPKDAITLLHQALTSAEPGWLHEALKRASEEYNEPEVKTARDAVRHVLAV